MQQTSLGKTVLQLNFKKEKKNQKMGRTSKQTFLQRRHANGQQAHEEILNITNDSVQFSHSVVSNSMRPHGLQHARLPCPSPTLEAFSNLCPSSLLQHQSSKASILWHSAFFIVQHSHPYMTTGKTIAFN